MNASGCGATVKEYGHHLPTTGLCGQARVSAMTRDLSEILPSWVPVLKPKLAAAAQADDWRCTAVHAAACAEAQGGLEAGLRAGLHGRAAGRQPSVLRFGRHLLGAAAGALAQSTASANRPAWWRSSPTPSCRPTSAASRTCRPAARRRCGTGWKCSTPRCAAERPSGQRSGPVQGGPRRPGVLDQDLVGLTMPSSRRARSSMISVPSRRSRISARSRSLRTRASALRVLPVGDQRRELAHARHAVFAEPESGMGQPQQGHKGHGHDAHGRAGTVQRRL